MRHILLNVAIILIAYALWGLLFLALEAPLKLGVWVLCGVFALFTWLVVRIVLHHLGAET